MTNPRIRGVVRVRAGLASVALVAVFAVVFPPAFVAGFEGIVPLFDPDDYASGFIAMIIVTLFLVSGFSLGSGWVLTRFSLVVDGVSAVVASGFALVSLSVWLVTKFWMQIDWESYRESFGAVGVRSRMIESLAGTSLAVVPLWLLYSCAVGFAHYRLNRIQPTAAPATLDSE